MGPYVLQAALAARYARARRAADTDWPRIAALYDRLRVVAPSPVVDLNRAIAHSIAARARPRAQDHLDEGPPAAVLTVSSSAIVGDSSLQPKT